MSGSWACTSHHTFVEYAFLARASQPFKERHLEEVVSFIKGPVQKDHILTGTDHGQSGEPPTTLIASFVMVNESVGSDYQKNTAKAGLRLGLYTLECKIVTSF